MNQLSQCLVVALAFGLTVSADTAVERYQYAKTLHKGQWLNATAQKAYIHTLAHPQIAPQLAAKIQLQLAQGGQTAEAREALISLISQHHEQTHTIQLAARHFIPNPDIPFDGPGCILNHEIISDVEINGLSLLAAINKIKKMTKASDPDKQGINIIYSANSEAAPDDPKITINHKHIRLKKLLAEVATQAGADWKIEDYAVVFAQRNAPIGKLEHNRYVLDRHSWSWLKHNASPNNEPASDQQVLEANGVYFPEGTWAQYQPKVETLDIINTAHNLERLRTALIARIPGPEQARVEIRLIEILDMTQLPQDPTAAMLVAMPPNTRRIRRIYQGLALHEENTTYGSGIENVSFTPRLSPLSTICELDLSWQPNIAHPPSIRRQQLLNSGTPEAIPIPGTNNQYLLVEVSITPPPHRPRPTP